MNSITIRGLNKAFGKKQALSDIDLEIKEGCIYGLLGRNGAGKSTLMNIISGRIPPDSGSAEIDGRSIFGSDKELSQIHMMSEQELYSNVRVSELFGITAGFYRSYDMEYAERLCKEFELDPKKKIFSLSTGYRTIAKLINALACNSPFVFLDEPVLGLDAPHRDIFYRSLTENYAETGRTFVISTHIIEEIAGITERTVILKSGKLILDDDTDALRSMGFTVSGKADEADAFAQGMNIIGTESLCGLKSISIMGAIPEEVPPSLEISPLGIQKLFICLTNSERTDNK